MEEKKAVIEDKIIIILNGSGGCGKDTFVSFVKENVPCCKYSSIDRVKELAKECGWTGEKTERDRQFLSDFKKLLIEYNDLPFFDVYNFIQFFLIHGKKEKFCIVDIREPEEIEKIKDVYEGVCPVYTVLIDASERVPVITSNSSDSEILDYNYDFILANNGSKKDLELSTKTFLNELGVL